MTFFIVISYNIYEDTKRSYDQNKFHELRIKLNQTFRDFNRNCDFLISQIRCNSVVNEIILNINTSDSAKSNILRKRLYDEINKMALNFEDLGIFKLYFVRLDRTIFLRYFNPEQYNDSFAYQTLLEKVINTKLPQSGFSPGANDFSYRRIYPYNINGNTIAYIEFALSEQHIADAFSYDRSRLTVLNYYFNEVKALIPKNLIKSPFIKNYYISKHFKDTLESYIPPDLPKIIINKLHSRQDLNVIVAKKNDFNFHFESISSMYSVYFIPIYNESNQFYGYILHAFKNITLENKFYDLLVINLALGIFLIIIMFVIAYRRDNEEQLKQKIAELQAEKNKSQNLIERLNKSQEELKEKAEFTARINNLLHEQELTLRKNLDEKNRFFSILAHDIKNPISSIFTNTELLTLYFDRMDDNEKKEIANRLLNSAKNLEKLVKDLLEWGRLQLGQYKVELKELLLKDEIDQIVETYKEIAQQKNNVIENFIPNNIKVTSDPHILRTIFRNLIQNSIKFTENGKISIELVEQKNNHIKIAVRDTGVGIPQDKINDLFRVDKTFSTRGTRDEEGTGLGLILVYDYLQKIEGSIAVDSKIGAGTVFYITFPKKKID